MTDNPIVPVAPTEPLKTLPVANLSDLEPATINLAIMLMDGAEVLLPVKLLSQYRMRQLNAMIPDVKPPVDDIKKVDGEIKPIYNYNDLNYLAAASEIAFKRNTLILVEMIQIPIPGDDLNAKADYIRTNFDPTIIDQVVDVIRQQREKAKARVVARADMFLG